MRWKDIILFKKLLRNELEIPLTDFLPGRPKEVPCVADDTVSSTGTYTEPLYCHSPQGN
jgi:hypothetical protein